jgi:hypothetical protein
LASAKYLIFYPLESSRAERIIYFKLSPMTVPGPTVHGPPKQIIILGGTGAISAKHIDKLIAWPVALELLSFTVIV